MRRRASGIRWFVLLGVVVWCGVAALPQPGRSSCVAPEQDCACTIAAELKSLREVQIIRAEVLEITPDSGVFRVLALEGGASGGLSVGDEPSLSLRWTECNGEMQPLEVGEQVWGAVSRLGSRDMIMALRWEDGEIRFEPLGGDRFNGSPLPDDQRDLLLDYAACEEVFGDQNPPCNDTNVDTDLCSISSLGGR